jgi:hypothetical protein
LSILQFEIWTSGFQIALRHYYRTRQFPGDSPVFRRYRKKLALPDSQIALHFELLLSILQFEIWQPGSLIAADGRLL